VIGQARFAASLLVRDRPLLRDYARFFVAGRKAQTPPRRRPQAGAITIDAALELVTAEVGAWTYGAAYDALRERELSERAHYGGGAKMSGDSALGRFVYAVVRARRPDVVIETGVATGVTSAHILAALADNEHGELHSVDLPPTDMLRLNLVGAAIPEELKGRWHYHWGSATRLLEKILGDARGRRVFVHDSDHSYSHMAWEIETAWRHLSAQDVIVCDDVDFHEAFSDTARALGGEPILVQQAEDAGTTGFLLRV
jgi:predicted O-methyltransferase YrrM